MGMLYEYEAWFEAEQSEQARCHPALFGVVSESSSRSAQSWSAPEDGSLGVRDVGPGPSEPTKEAHEQ